MVNECNDRIQHAEQMSDSYKKVGLMIEFNRSQAVLKSKRQELVDLYSTVIELEVQMAALDEVRADLHEHSGSFERLGLKQHCDNLIHCVDGQLAAVASALPRRKACEK